VPILLKELQRSRTEFHPGNAKRRPTWSGAACVEVLGAIGPEAKEAVPLLLKLHDQSRNPFIYLTLARAVKKIDPAAAHKAGIP
jgi:hypothetical protein